MICRGIIYRDRSFHHLDPRNIPFISQNRNLSRPCTSLWYFGQIFHNSLLQLWWLKNISISAYLLILFLAPLSSLFLISSFILFHSSLYHFRYIASLYRYFFPHVMQFNKFECPYSSNRDYVNKLIQKLNENNI